MLKRTDLSYFTIDLIWVISLCTLIKAKELHVFRLTLFFLPTLMFLWKVNGRQTTDYGRQVMAKAHIAFGKMS